MLYFSLGGCSLFSALSLSFTHPLLSRSNIVRLRTDPMTIEERVKLKLREQCRKGLELYGETVDRDDMTKLQWLEHAQEEAIDMAIYLEKLIQMERPSRDSEVNK